LLFEFTDLLFFRLDLTLKLLDFVVKHEFEFFQFLCLFLEPVNLVLFFPDRVVFLDDLKRFLSNFIPQFFYVFILCLQLLLFVLLLACEFVDFELGVSKLIFGELQVGLALEAHFVDLL
jgi:hypothetical protein